MSNIEVLKQAIEALEENVVWFSTDTMIGRSLKEKTNKAIASLNQAIAELESQEPVAWRYDQAKYRTNDLRGRQWAFNVFSQARPYMDEMVQNVTPLYTTPPQRTWIGLTDEEIAETLGDEIDSVYMTDFRRVEAKLKQKNGFAEEKKT